MYSNVWSPGEVQQGCLKVISRFFHSRLKLTTYPAEVAVYNNRKEKKRFHPKSESEKQKKIISMNSNSQPTWYTPFYTSTVTSNVTSVFLSSVKINLIE